jgi:hypothetical protein
MKNDKWKVLMFKDYISLEMKHKYIYVLIISFHQIDNSQPMWVFLGLYII